MRPTTLAGALVAGAALLAGGLALASRKKPAPGSEPPYFVYTLAPGDTLSALALRFFGDGDKWPVLRQAMPELRKDAVTAALPVGSKIQVPCIWTSVGAGETLAAIAKRTLGDAGRWKRIAEANKAALPDPNKLAVGQRLAVPLLPAEAPAAAPPAVAPAAPSLLPPAAEPPPISVGGDLDLLDAEAVGSF